jgi:hypothetical protein
MATFTASLDKSYDDTPRHHRTNDHGEANHDPTGQWRPQTGGRRRNAYCGRREGLYIAGARGVIVGATEPADSPNDDSKADIPTGHHPSRANTTSHLESCVKYTKGQGFDSQSEKPFFQSNDGKRTSKRKKNSFYLFHPVGTGPERAAKAQKAHEILTRIHSEQALKDQDEDTASFSSSDFDDERPTKANCNDDQLSQRLSRSRSPSLRGVKRARRQEILRPQSQPTTGEIQRPPLKPRQHWQSEPQQQSREKEYVVKNLQQYHKTLRQHWRSPSLERPQQFGPTPSTRVALQPRQPQQQEQDHVKGGSECRSQDMQQYRSRRKKQASARAHSDTSNSEATLEKLPSKMGDPASTSSLDLHSQRQQPPLKSMPRVDNQQMSISRTMVSTVQKSHVDQNTSWAVPSVQQKPGSLAKVRGPSVLENTAVLGIASRFLTSYPFTSNRLA